MLATLGNIVFEPPNSFQSLIGDHEISYAEHQLIGRKPRLQRTGSGLQKYQFQMKLRPEFVSPEGAMLQLDAAKEASQVLPFVLGNGRYLGNFVIKRSEVVTSKTFADGSILEAVISVELLEYATDNLLPAQVAQALASAFSRLQNTPVTTADLSQSSGDGTAALSSVKNIRSTARRVRNTLRQAQQVNEKRKAAFAATLQAVQTMNENLQNARTLVTQGVAVIKNAERALASLDDVQASLTSLNVAAGLENITTAVQAGNDLESAVRLADAAFSGLAGMVIGRDKA
jgi:phage protein U